MTWSMAGHLTYLLAGLAADVVGPLLLVAAFYYGLWRCRWERAFYLLLWSTFLSDVGGFVSNHL
jgi:hypothetical protein